MEFTGAKAALFCGASVLTYLRDTQVYVQATAAGMTIFDLPPSRAERDLEQWQAIIEWAEAGE